MVQIISVAALCLFTVLMVATGIYGSKKVSGSMDGFLLGGRNIGPWMSAFSYGTSYFSAVIFVGYAGTHGWNIGIGSIWIGIGNAILGCLLAWLALAKPTRRMTHRLGVKTMPEFFEARFSSKSMKIYAAVIIFIFLVPYAASVYKGLGSLFGAVFPNVSDYFFGLSPDIVCMFIVALLTAVYLVLGGYMATAVTDFIQGIIMIVGVFIMVIAITNHPNVGGIANLFTKLKLVDASLVDPFGGSNWKFLLVNILLTSFGTWGLPQMVHKFYAIKDEASIRHATVVSTVFALIIGCGAYFVGTMGRFFVPAAADGTPVGGFDAVIPSLLMQAFSNGIFFNILLSIVLLLVLSASMSTLSSLVLSSSSAVSVDLVGAYKKDMKPKSQVALTRVLCFLFVALSFLFASFNFAIIVSIMSFSWGVVSGCFIGPFLWGLHSRKVTKAGAWCGLVSGLLVVLLMLAYDMAVFRNSLSVTGAQGIYSAFQLASQNAPIYGVVAMAVSVVIVPLVSLFTKKPGKEQVARCFGND